MPVNIIVNGANGRMGTLACAAIEQDAELNLVAKCDKNNGFQQYIEKNSPSIVVDLTNAHVVDENAKKILASGANAVIGTSGLSDKAKNECDSIAKKNNLRILIVPNFSIGAVLMMKFAAEAAPYFQDIEITERHHAQKLDFPSGTAIATAKIIAENRDKNSKLNIQEEKSIIANTTRGAKSHGITIHSQRMAGFLADQNVMFSNMYENLTIHHNTSNRLCFMPGLILACKKLLTLPIGAHTGLDKILWNI